MTWCYSAEWAGLKDLIEIDIFFGILVIGVTKNMFLSVLCGP